MILGWLFGALILSVFLALWGPVVGWLKQRTTLQQVLLAAAVVAVLLACQGLLVSGMRGYAVPAEWMKHAARARGVLPAPVTMSGAITDTGALFGLALGLVWMQRMGGYQPSGPAWKRLACLVTGVLGVGVLYAGLKVVFPSGEDLVGSVFRFVRYALLGLWIAGGAPYAFMRLGLTGERTSPMQAASASG